MAGAGGRQPHLCLQGGRIGVPGHACGEGMRGIDQQVCLRLLLRNLPGPQSRQSPLAMHYAFGDEGAAC